MMGSGRTVAAQRAEQGFSLVEVLVTLAILSVVVMIATPFASPHRRAETASAVAFLIKSELVKARMRSLAEGRVTTIHLDLAKRQLTDEKNVVVVQLPDSMSIQARTGQELVTSDGEATILFYADGAASGAEIGLTDVQGDSVTVVVPWLTGVPTIR